MKTRAEYGPDVNCDTWTYAISWKHRTWDPTFYGRMKLILSYDIVFQDLRGILFVSYFNFGNISCIILVFQSIYRKNICFPFLCFLCFLIVIFVYPSFDVSFICFMKINNMINFFCFILSN